MRVKMKMWKEGSGIQKPLASLMCGNRKVVSEGDASAVMQTN